MFQNKYDFYIGVEAIQRIDLNSTDKNIEYGEIVEVAETQWVEIYDMTKETEVARIPWNPHDDQAMYRIIKDTIQAYEECSLLYRDKAYTHGVIGEGGTDHV